jgi:hypothetical protein
MFKREAEMAPSVARWMTRENLLTKAEFATPFGICDLVGVTFRPDRVAHRIRLRQTRPIASFTRASILQLIPDVDTGRRIKALSVFKTLAATLPGDIIAAEIERLVRDRFVVWRGKTCLQKVNGWAPLHRRIVAVELKLARVEDALAQAKAHLAFADESYVGLPAAIAARVHETPTRWARYWDLGVGLLAVTKSQCRILRPSSPLPTSQDEALQIYIVDKFWREGSEAVKH